MERIRRTTVEQLRSERRGISLSQFLRPSVMRKKFSRIAGPMHGHRDFVQEASEKLKDYAERRNL